MPEAHRLRGKDRLRYLLATGLGLGRLKPGPGTWASAATAIVVGVWMLLAPATAGMGMAVVAFALVLLGLWSCPVAVACTRRQDPPQVVIDEILGVVAGCAVLPAQAGLWSVVGCTLGVLLAFRLLDIFKPWPVRAFERLPGTWGILADDAVAGVLAGLLTVPFAV